MKIGYLHLGPPQHGICRYGKFLARAAKERSDLTVLEAEAILTGDSQSDRQKLIAAAQQLRAADLVHIQFSYFNDRLWGSGWMQLESLKTFLDGCDRAIAVTLHDVYYTPPNLRGIATQVLPAVFPFFGAKRGNSDLPQRSEPPVSDFKRAARAVKEWSINTFGASTATLQALAQRADLVLVCTQVEANRLADRLEAGKLKIVPHFVESRPRSLTRVEARKSLNLEGFKVVTLLGFIYPYKGYQLLIEAMAELPSEVRVIFAGSIDADPEFVRSLLQLAKEKGVEDRLQLTGYLSETELETYLMATDLAVCPFAEFSASGSISTWISVACPILASSLPQIAEYNALELDAIGVFHPYTAAALATAIKDCLANAPAAQQAKVARLAQKLSLANIFERHLSVYQPLRQEEVVRL
jgi:glycosyltransferase involved in cell wall biosynthesis